MNKVLSTWFKRYFSHPESVVLLMVLVVTIVVLTTIGNVLAPVIVSVILAYLLFGMVKKLQKWRCPHFLAVSVIFLFFMSLFLLLFLYLLPLLWEQLINLVSEIPAALNHGQTLLFGLHDRFPELISVNQLRQIIAYVTTYLADFGKELVTFSLASLFSVVTLIVYLVLVPLLVFFFLRDGKVIIDWLMGLLPEKHGVLENIWREVYGKVSSYIRGKVIEVMLVAIVTIVAFEILELHYAVLLGALVGLSVMIPYIGMVVVTVPIVVVGLIQWGWSGHFFYMMLVYTVISIIDANVLVPILFAEVMKLHPLAIILAVLIFGGLFGFWGVFFAIPLMALVNVVIELWPRELE